MSLSAKYAIISPMGNTMALIAKSFVDLVYPRRCANCGRDTAIHNKLCLCGSCAGDIRRNPRPHCRTCGRPVDTAGAVCGECRKTKFYFTRAYSAYLYDGAFKEVIHLFKYKSRISLSGHLGMLMIEFIREEPGILKDIDIITVVPLDNRRLRDRGFNQSKALASRIAEEFAVPLADMLEKAVRTRHQNELSRDERLRNLDGAFRIRRDAAVRGLNILLIDDVMTTGSTLNECSKILIEAGAGSVRCLTLARGI